jgi:arginyl-tRNA synthetase
LAVGFEKYGSETELESDPIKHLYDVYVRINGDAEKDDTIHDAARFYFKKMEDGDPVALALWKKFRDLSIVAYKKIYARINVHFDVYSGESQYSLDQMQGVLKQLNEMGLLTKLEGGAMAVDLQPYDLGTAVIGKTDGSMLYISRDIAAASDRFDQYEFDEMYYVVGAQQYHHFKQLFKILELQGKTWADRCHHIGFGLIKSKDGNMSTRKGTVVFLQDILDHVKEEMHQVMKKNETKYAQIEDPDHVSDVVGISSIIIQDLSAKRIKDYAFDWARMLSFEGDSGPYLQYAHARLCSIARGSSYTVDPENVKDYLPLLTERHALDLIEVISQYPSLVRNLPGALEPCAVVVYALRISHCVSAAYTDLWVHGAEKDVAIARLALYNAARVCLGNALKLLGLLPLERM